MQLARAVVNAGADLIIGYHPHVLRGVEKHGRGWIVYSLGNFVCDMLWEEELRETAIAAAKLQLVGELLVVGRISKSYELGDHLKVLLQDLERIVRAAIGTEREHAVDRIIESTALAGQRRLDVLLDIVSNRFWRMTNLQTEADPKRTTGRNVEFVFLQLLGHFSHHLAANERPGSIVACKLRARPFDADLRAKIERQLVRRFPGFGERFCADDRAHANVDCEKLFGARHATAARE